MSNRLYKAIEKALFQRWGKRLPDLQEDAIDAEAAGMSPREAYLAGAQAAYFNAVADLVSEDMVREPPPVPELPLMMVGATDEVH